MLERSRQGEHDGREQKEPGPQPYMEAEAATNSGKEQKGKEHSRDRICRLAQIQDELLHERQLNKHERKSEKGKVHQSRCTHAMRRLCPRCTA